ncbi:MAG: YlcI/YnfO family protein [Dehalococcoidia bacterium]
MVAAHRDAMTVRIPSELLSEAKQFKKDGESLNELIVTALANETKYRRGKRATDDIKRIREEILATSGPQPDATPMIRAMRDGSGWRE